MKYIFFILLLISGTCYGQTKYYIRADTTQLEKVGGNNELNLLNSTRSRTGAYLKNTSNGRTGFFYAVDSAYISGTNLVLVRGGGSQNVTVAIPSGSTPTWQQTLVAGSTLNQDNNIDAGGNTLNITNLNELSLLSGNSGLHVGPEEADLQAYSNINSSINSAISVYAAEISINPHQGELYIDSLNYTLNTTRKKILVRDTLTGDIYNIDPSLVTAGVASSVPINGLTAATGSNTVAMSGFDFGLTNSGNIEFSGDGSDDFFIQNYQASAIAGTISEVIQIQGGEVRLGVGITPNWSRIMVEKDTIHIQPRLGSLVIDSLNYTLSSTRKKLMIRDTVTGLVENIDPSLIGGGGLTIGTTAIASGTTTRLLFEGTSNILQEDADFTVDQTNNLINSYASSSAGKVQIGQLNTVSGYGAIYFGQTPSATNYAIAGTTTELLINSGFGDIKYMYGTLLVGKQIDTRWGIGYNVAPLTGTELTVTTGDATFRALVLKAVGSQSENIMEVRDNSDAILSRVGPTGEIRHSTLAGSGSRSVLADAEGDLSAPVSDRRVKENIRPMSSALGMIGAFNPVTFEYKEGYKKFGNGTQVGFIAQEIDEILPNSVYTNADGTKGYNATDLIPILVKAVQEQQKMIDDLQKEIKTLKKQK